MFAGAQVQTANAAGSKVTKPVAVSTINSDNLVLPEDISAFMIDDYSKSPNKATDGDKPYSCLAIYLVSSRNSATVVKVTDLTLATSSGGKNLLHGGALSGYLTVGRKTSGSDFLPSSQALGRLSPSGTFSDPVPFRNPGVAAVPDVLNCQTASIGRMFGLTVASDVEYRKGKTLYLSGQVEFAKPSKYSLSGVTVPDGYVAGLSYVDDHGYSVSCITRDGRFTTIGIALKNRNYSPDSPDSQKYLPSGKYIARDVLIDGVSSPTLGIPNFRSLCIPVASVPGDYTGDRTVVISANIIEWPGTVTNEATLTGDKKLAKVLLGAADSDEVPVTYDPSLKKSFVWLTAKSRGKLDCVSTSFDYSGLTGTYVIDAKTIRGKALVETTTAKKFAAGKASSGGADTYAVMSFAGNVFDGDGELTLKGKIKATDNQCAN